MQPNERRFQERFDAAPLKLEIHTVGLKGLFSKPQMAFARNFALGGLSARCTRKLKPGQHIILNIETHDHRIQSIPAVVLRSELTDKEWHCALAFSLDNFSDNVRQFAYSVLKHLEASLKQHSIAA